MILRVAPKDVFIVSLYLEIGIIGYINFNILPIIINFKTPNRSPVSEFIEEFYDFYSLDYNFHMIDSKIDIIYDI